MPRSTDRTVNRADWLITRCAVAETILLVLFVLLAIGTAIDPSIWDRIGIGVIASAGALVAAIAVVMWVAAGCLISTDDAMPDKRKRSWMFMLIVFNFGAAYVFGMMRLRRQTIPS